MQEVTGDLENRAVAGRLKRREGGNGSRGVQAVSTNAKSKSLSQLSGKLTLLAK